MATLPAAVDSLDAVPEKYRDAYVQSGSQFVLDADVDSHPAVAGLKANRTAALNDKRKIETQLAALKPLMGEHTPEEIAEILAAHKTQEEDRAKKAGEFDKIRERDAKKIRDEYEPVVKERDIYRTKYESLEYETTVSSAFLTAGGDPEKLKHAQAIARDRIQRGKSGLEVLDEMGEPSGKTIKDFFASDFKKEAPFLFLGSDASGSGMRGGSGSKPLGAGIISARDANAFSPENTKAILSGKLKVQ